LSANHATKFVALLARLAKLRLQLLDSPQDLAASGSARALLGLALHGWLRGREKGALAVEEHALAVPP
jgi:hypothetical protein